MGLLWIEGELSNFSRPASGHFYFSLKDSRAQLRCAMFKGRNRHLNFTPDNGQQVLVRGKLGVYEARGDFQLIVEHMEPAGAGLLQQQFEEIKQRLQTEGLFAAERKQALPLWPNTIGVVTSPTGAAVHDILNVLRRRYPRARVIIYPTLVQGAAAVQPICHAIDLAASRNDCEVLIVARGGGSLEDLWAFNDEQVARRIAACPIPVIAGVGHEIDYTITDMVADHRAPTPSSAAELATPDSTETGLQLQVLRKRLLQSIQHHTAPLSTLLQQLLSRLQLRHPQRVVVQESQRVDELDSRLRKAIVAISSRHNARLSTTRSRLALHSPGRRVEQMQVRMQALRTRLVTQATQGLALRGARLAEISRALETVSPLATLSRGYSVVRKNSQIITKAADVSPGDSLGIQLADGELVAQVLDISTDSG